MTTINHHRRRFLPSRSTRYAAPQYDNTVDRTKATGFKILRPPWNGAQVGTKRT